MLLRHLRYFSAVAAQGSIVAGAKALRVAQPSLSRQLRALESEIGVQLLERVQRGVRVTPAGTALLTHANDVAEQIEEALRRTHLADQGRLGTIRLGLGRAALQSRRTGRAIAAMRTRLPDVALEVSEICSFSHVAALRNGEVDVAIGLLGTREEPGASRATLFAEVADCAMLSAAHPLAHERSIRASQLRSERLLMIDPAISLGFDELYRALQRIHKGPIEMHETVDSLFSLVTAGQGWAPALSALRHDPPHGTVVIPLDGFSVPLIMGVSCRVGDRSRLTANVIAALRDESAGKPVASSRMRLESARRTTHAPGCVPSGLETRHLRALVVTAAEGSARRAASRLGITQSGLYRQLRTLEQEIGVRLFRRGPNGVVPNAAGEVLLTHATTLLATIDEALGSARGGRRVAPPPCRIGSMPCELTGDLLTGLIRHIGEESPDVTLEVVEMLTPLQVSALHNREIDIGIAGAYEDIDDPAIASVQLRDDMIDSALLSTSHPLADRAWLTAADLADLPFLFMPRASAPPVFDVVVSALDRIGLTPRIEGSFKGARAVWRLTADAMGWTLGTRYMRANPPAGLVCIPIEGLQIPTGVRILWRRDEENRRVTVVLDGLRLSGRRTTDLPPAAQLSQTGRRLASAG